jgi:small multidrug resistance family-3 protein
MKTLVIDAGRQDKLRPGDILGALKADDRRRAGHQPIATKRERLRDIGKIDVIFATRAYVAISRIAGEQGAGIFVPNKPNEWLMRAGKIKGRNFRCAALAEIVGCYLPWLVLKQGKTAWLLVPAAISLALFSWLLTLHPSAAGRTYAAYGGIYIAVALLWLRYVDGVALTRWDIAGACVALLGMAIIVVQPHR